MAPGAGEAALGDAERGQQQKRGDQKLGVEKGMAKLGPGAHESGNRRDRQDPDGSHEIEMRQLAPRHAQHQIGQMHRIELVLVEVERALQKRQPSEERGDKKERGWHGK